MIAASKQELADEQLDALLEACHSAPSSSENLEKDFNLEHLVKEVMELTTPPSAPPASPALPTLPVEEKKKKRSTSTIWITATLLFGLTAGSALGVFWGKSQNVLDQPILEPQQEITGQISHWIEELQTLYNTLESSPPSEVIEPLEPPSEMEVIAPTELT
ncbi:MAG: hypothetical protein S4CHLAM2_12330 [Chlamydiales bacterium]|nr:hypothetical protein [Chlamydiales bacterium]